ncbi:MAG TPA: TIGR01440 family protein, partial [Clostridiales bacterium]|nr:TIGR01440 family protein [Clostridiales bacterium]
MYEDIRSQARAAMSELLALADPGKGSLVVVGCSSSEIVGEQIGKNSVPDAAAAVIEGIMPLLEERGLYLAAQCCEHL